MSQTTMLFKKPLKSTDITKRLAIQTKSLKFLPHFNGGHAIKLNVTHEGRVWPMVCSTRRQGHKKPVLSNGWIPFVRENRLNVGDVVALYKEENEAGWQYLMEVDRAATATPYDKNNLGVAVPLPHETKRETEFKRFGKAVDEMNLEFVSCPKEIVLNLDLTLGPPGELSG